MLFAARKEFLQGTFDEAGLLALPHSKRTPQETFVAQTRRAEVLLALGSVAQLVKGFQPSFELSRLAQNQNRELYLGDGF